MVTQDDAVKRRTAVAAMVREHRELAGLNVVRPNSSLIVAMSRSSLPTSTKRTYVWGVTVLMLLASCGSDKASGPQWDDYTPSLKTDIDALASAKDCPALQEQFDAADANNDATKARTGHNNAELLTYIDAKLRSAGCY